MFRISSLIAAAATSVLLLSATAASAQAPNGFYAAKPITAASANKFVVRDTIWRCGPDGCMSAAKGQSRPAIVCEALVKQVGAIESFRAGGEAFDAAALAKCNAKA